MSVVLHLRGLLILCVVFLAHFNVGTGYTYLCHFHFKHPWGPSCRSPCSEITLVPLGGPERTLDVDYPVFFDLLVHPMSGMSLALGQSKYMAGPFFDFGSIFANLFWAMQLSGNQPSY